MNLLINKLSKYLSNKELNIIKNLINSTNLDYINKSIININNKFKLDLPLYKYGYGLSIGLVVNQTLSIFF